MPPFDTGQPPAASPVRSSTVAVFDPSLRPEVHEWSVEHPFVVGLLDELRAARSAASCNGEAELIDYFIGRAEDDGTLPEYNGRISSSAIAAACSRTHFDTGRTRTGRIFNRFKLAFWPATARLETEDDPSIPLTHRIDRLIRRSAAAGEGLPRVARTRRVNLGVIADRLGVPRYSLAADSAGAKRLRAALRNGEIDLGVGIAIARTDLTEEQETRLAELRAVVAGFDVPGGRVPESANYRGSPDFAYIAQLTGRAGDTMQDHAPYARYVREVAKRRGTVAPGLMLSIDTLAAVRDFGRDAIEREQKAKDNATWQSARDNFASAVKRFVETLGLDWSDDAAEAFGADFEENLARAKATQATAGAARNFERNVRRAHDLRLERLGAGGLPDGFQEALSVLIARKNLSIPALGRAIGVSPQSLRSWTSGDHSPSAGAIATIAKLEKFFKLPGGLLASKIPPMRIRQVNPSGWSPEYAALTPDERLRLPDVAAQWSPDRLADAVLQIRPLLAGASDFGRMLQAAASDDCRYAPFDPSPRLARQLKEYLAYKTSTTTELDRGGNSQWSEPTVGIRQPLIEQFFRFASSPVTDLPGCGLGLPATDATMAWFSNPRLVLAFMSARASRFADLEDENGKARGVVWSNTELQFARLARSMTHPKHGWLTQQPDLAGELRPIPVVISETQRVLLDKTLPEDAVILSDAGAEAAAADWTRWCAQAHRLLDQVDEHLQHRVDTVRNPFLPIEGLMLRQEPLAELLARILAYRNQWADERTSEKAYMFDVRNTVMIWLHAVTAFRPSNLYELTYRPDQTGKIRKVDGVWVIEVPYDEFKNFRNSDLFGTSTNRQDYRRTLVDEGGLYEVLDLYFFDVRSRFRNAGLLDAAFISREGNRISDTSYRHALERFSRLFLEWNPVMRTGIPGMLHFYPYAFRHVVASAMLRTCTTENRYERAARALQTSVEMIRRHYGWLLPDQALAGPAEAFSASMSQAQLIASSR